MIPGRTLHRLAIYICSARTLERIVEPAIADLQKEYSQHGASPLSWLSALARGYLAAAKVIGICAIDLSEATTDDRRVVIRTAMWWVGLTTAMVALLAMPVLAKYPIALKNPYLGMTVLPQAVPLAVPIGLAFAIAWGLRPPVSMSTAKLILLGAVAASFLSFGTLAWVLPGASEAFRETTIRELRARGFNGDISRLPKGLSEMRLSELRREMSDASVGGEFRHARRFSWAFHFRFALAVAAVALAAVMLALPVDNRFFRAWLAFAGCVLYWALIFVGEVTTVRSDYWTPFAGAWLPNFALLALAILVSLRQLRVRTSGAI